MRSLAKIFACPLEQSLNTSQREDRWHCCIPPNKEKGPRFILKSDTLPVDIQIHPRALAVAPSTTDEAGSVSIAVLTGIHENDTSPPCNMKAPKKVRKIFDKGSPEKCSALS
jgi:hypothetical protein